MTGAVEQLVATAMMADPFRDAPSDLAALQMEAVRERFADRRQRIKVLDRRARDEGVTDIASLKDIVPLLFAHTNYKSYPEAFIDGRQWKGMNAWLSTLSAYPTADIDVAGVEDVDDWLNRAEAAGHFLFASSGTSGKSSFLDQSAAEMEAATVACINAWDIGSPGFAPAQDRDVFTQLPTRGPHKMVGVTARQMERVARPGHIHRITNEPIRAMDTMRAAQIRRLLGAGKISPSETAAYEEEQKVRQRARAQAMEEWIDLIVARRHDPIYFALMWGATYNLVEALRARGVKDGDFHPEVAMSLGGGTKGAVLPSDYKEQIFRFFGVDQARVSNSYAMVEMSGFCALIQPHDVYAIPPWIIPLVLDKSGEVLLNPDDGKGVVEGRMAFFDVLTDARWGGIISGDKVQVEFGSGLDGVKTPIVRSVARYQDLAEGEDKLSCAGSIDAYVRGSVAA